MPGKWLTFWCNFILKKVLASISRSVHQTSQSPMPLYFCMIQPSSSATSSTMGYCVSEILMTIFLCLGLSPSLAMGIYLGELSVSTSTEA